MKLRIAHLSTFYHTSILLLARGGIDEQLRAEVEWKLFSTGPAIMQAFDRNEIDLAYVGLPPMIIGMDRKVRVQCVAGGHVEGTVLAAKSRWRGLSKDGAPGEVFTQFRGRSIGVPGKGSIHDVILKHCIAQYGLEREVEVKNYSWADLVLEAVMRDEVAAAMGTPALAAAIKRYAAGEVLVPPSMLWPFNPSYGIAVDRRFLEKEPGGVESFLRAHESATTELRTKPEEAARAIAEYIGIVDAEFVRDALSISPRYCAHLSEEFIASTMKFVPVMKRLGYIKSDPGADRIFFRDLIDRVHPGRDHYGDISSHA